MYDVGQFYREKESLKNHMPFGRLIEPGIVVNKDGGLMRSFRFRGPDLDSTSKEHLGIITYQLNSTFSTLGTGWVLYFESQRHPSTSYATDVYFPDAASQAIDDERRTCFESGTCYENDYFLTLYWRPPIDVEGKLKELMIEGEQRKQVNAEEHLRYFIDQTNKIQTVLRSLQIPETEDLGMDGTATYLHSVVSPVRHAIKIPATSMLLDSLLFDSDFVGGQKSLLRDYHIRVVVPMSFEGISEFGQFNEFNRLTFPYRFVTRYFFLDKVDALKELNTRLRHWKSKLKSFVTTVREAAFGPSNNTEENLNAKHRVAEITEAIRSVEADEVGYGFYSNMIVVSDKDQDTAKAKAEEIRSKFLAVNIGAQIEEMNAIDAWFGSIPGNVCCHVRRPMISTGNLVHMLPLTDMWSGPQRNDHLNGPPLIYTLTDGNSPFRLDLHYKDVGHSMLIGPTGSGKSVHLNLIAAQFLKYERSTVIIFEAGGSSRVLTEAVGGRYYNLGNESETELSFQPLAQISNPNERTWAAEWLYDFLRMEEYTVNPEVKMIMEDALKTLAGMPVELRTLSGLVSNIQDQSLRDALRALTVDGPYGRIFDGSVDTLSFGRWQVFEMETLMKFPLIVSPAMMYMFHRIEQLIVRDSDPLRINLDEAWKYFKNATFSAKIEEWLKVLRKYNGSVTFATQDLDAVTKHPIFSTILNNCFSRIFLPNPNAFEKNNRETYRAFGLSDQQLSIIANAISKQHYYFTSVLGSRLYDLSLGPVAMALCGSTNSADQEDCVRLLAEYGQEHFLDHWLRFKGVTQKEEE